MDPNAPGIMNIEYGSSSGVWDGLNLIVFVQPASDSDVPTSESPASQGCASGNSLVSSPQAVQDYQIQIELPPGDYCVSVQRLNGMYYVDSPISVEPADPDDDVDMSVP